MSDNLTLEDGRTWWASTIIVANVLNEVADALENRNVKFSVWLKDKSDRPAPFMHFDLRGLSNECVEQFYMAACKSFNRLSTEYGEKFTNSPYGEAFSRLIKMHEHIVGGGNPKDFTDLEEVLVFDGEKIDFEELWSKA